VRGDDVTRLKQYSLWKSMLVIAVAMPLAVVGACAIFIWVSGGLLSDFVRLLKTPVFWEGIVVWGVILCIAAFFFWSINRMVDRSREEKRRGEYETGE
jgi:hypothetical protein